MLSLLNNLKISLKLYGLIGCGIAVFAIGMISLTFYDHSSLESERKNSLIGMDDTVLSVLENYHTREQSGELTREQAQQQAIAVVKGMRYTGDGYFWINDLNTVMVMHPTNPKLDGTDVSGITDPNGLHLFSEMVDVVKAKGKGFVDYMWPKPGFEQPVEKYSYVVGFEPWGWVVGTGVYVDDLAALFWRNASIIGAGVVIIMISTALVSYVVISSIVKPLTRLKTAVVEIASENTDVEVVGEGRKDEIGDMAGAVLILRESVSERAALRNKQAEQQRQLDEERATSEKTRQQHAEQVQASADAQAYAIDRLGSALERLADGELDNHIDEAFTGDLDRVRQAFNRTVEKLVGIVGQLKQTSRGVKTATGEILSGANDLSERTTKQAATIEETSAAMEQLAHTVMESAKRAGSASDQAKQASQTAEDGGKVMQQANNAMERISNSSAKISNIIGMIDDIAFQTNLLALNASVEAARAGESGKGFAVVAVEVRRLAQSAAEASSEVKVLIEQSGEEVSGGTRLVAEAAEKLSAILDAVRTNASEMETIAKDSREQASSIEEVNTAIRQMDEMTQHNAALVEETNAAIEQTENQASELDRIVEVFTLGDASAAPAAPRSSARVSKAHVSQDPVAVGQDWSGF